MAAQGSPARPGGRAEEEEPRLKYATLGSESPRVQGAAPSATRLGVSDKVLAVGHWDGLVQLLSHLGDQVREYREHTAEVTDLCFDDSAEYLVSSSRDGTVMVYGLYSEEVQRFKFGAPVTAAALDPRYGTRKTREFVYGTAAGCLALCSKGWLGNKETVLFQGKGSLRCARMSGTLLAWASDTGLRVYDTATHTRLGKLERPTSAAEDPAAPCSLLWRGERELFVGWGRHVWVLRVVGSLLPPASQPAGAAPGRSLQIVASFDAGCGVLGAAPFGAELAVLTWGQPGTGDGSGGGRAGAAGTAQVGAVLPVGATTSTEEQGVPAATAAVAAVTPAVADAAVNGVDAAGGTAQDADGGTAGEPPEAASSKRQQGQEQGQEQGQQQGGAPVLAGADGAAQQEQQEQQPLSLSFFSRAGQLLASDALGGCCAAPERRWRQLALIYPGEADLKLAAAVPPALAGTPQHSPAGSVAGSGRSSPYKTARAPGSTTSSRASPSKGKSSSATASPDGVSAGQQGQAQPPTEQQEDGGSESGTAVSTAAVQQYKWWRDGEEPMYLVSGPSGVIVGKPRDGNDRVAWLAERGRYSEALTVAEEDRSVQPATLASVGEQSLQALVSEKRYREAAALGPRVLKANELAWERWVFTFAQERQLAALAPVLPTSDPRLKPSTYDMVLASLLLHPSEHDLLLQVVKAWPQGMYDVSALQAAVLSRMGGAGSWPQLQQVAAHLYTAQGRHEEALQLQLQLRSPAVFDYIARHALVDRLAPYAAALVDLDEGRATKLLVEHCEEVPPAAVVAALQEAAGRAAQGEHRQAWRRRLHRYLDALFLKDSQAGAEFAELQVELYAEFEPSRLLHFLMVSPTYPLERAYQACEARGLTREMVYVLGRMGSAEKALRLIVEGLRDVGQAVEFVQLQRDDELWEQLIALTLGDAQLTGALLDHAGGYIDPLRVVSQIPQHMQVDNLRGRLVKIITDFRTQMCLQQGCNTILRHDCIVLANRLYRMLRSSLRRLHLRLPCQGGAAKWVLYDARTGSEAAEDDAPAALLGATPVAGTAADAPASTARPAGPTGSGAGSGSPLKGSSLGQEGAGQLTSPAAAAANGQHHQQLAQRVWVGFVGGPPDAERQQQGGPPAARRQEQQQRSPSKFVRLASGSPSPGPKQGASAMPRKLLVS